MCAGSRKVTLTNRVYLGTCHIYIYNRNAFSTWLSSNTSRRTSGGEGVRAGGRGFGTSSSAEAEPVLFTTCHIWGGGGRCIKLKKGNAFFFCWGGVGEVSLKTYQICINEMVW